MKPITALFNKFAGREIFPPFITAPDPVIEEMHKLAKDNGYNLRIVFPGMRRTMDYRGDRINAHINREPDGTYRVSRFNIG